MDELVLIEESPDCILQALNNDLIDVRTSLLVWPFLIKVGISRLKETKKKKTKKQKEEKELKKIRDSIYEGHFCV